MTDVPTTSPRRNRIEKDDIADESQELFVPGRVCLFGEHSDWAGSFTRFNADISPGVTIVCGTNQGLYARVRRHPSHLVITTTTDAGEKVGPFELELNTEKLLACAQEGGFFSYAAGVAYKICTDYRVGGLVIDNYKTDLPIRKGLSSSAAFCVLVARAFNRM
jgi:galactokinase